MVITILNYLVFNENKSSWITLIHCLGGSTRTWNKQIAFLSKYFNVLVIDLPYHGNSIVFNEKLTNENVNLSIKQVLDALNITKTHFLGFSLGTIVATNFVAQFPEYSNKVVLAGCSTMVVGMYKPMVKIINTIKNLVPCRFAYKVIASIMLPKPIHKKSREIFIREVANMNNRHFREWLAYISQITNFNNTVNKLNQSNTQILILVGSKDYCFLNGAKKMHEKLKNSQISILNKCGHICIVEQPDTINELSLAFLT